MKTIRRKQEIVLAHRSTSFDLDSSLSSPLPLCLLSFQLTAPGNSQPVGCTITPTQSGGCSISYTPAVRGPHQMRITVGGTDIPNSPFTVHVYPTPEMRGEPVNVIDWFRVPYGLAVSKTGKVVVSEYRADRICVFSMKENEITWFGWKGTHEGQLRYPCGVTFIEEHHVLVVNGDNNRLQMFATEQGFVSCVGSKGNGPLQFSSPCDVAVHPSSGKVFIVDTGNNRIQVLNDDLAYSHMFGRKGSGDGQFNQPLGVACDTRGNVYVTDCMNHRVQIFTPGGQLICSFNRGASQKENENDWYPSGISVDSMNTVYVSSGMENSLSIFNDERQFVKKFSLSKWEKIIYS